MAAMLWVALGGAIGSVARHGVNVIGAKWLGTGFPWSTFVVNVVGCCAIGFLSHLLLKFLPGNDAMRLFLTTGILGGFTTFSAFALDFAGLVERGQGALAAGYVLGSVGLSITAVFIGLFAARAIT